MESTEGLQLNSTSDSTINITGAEVYRRNATLPAYMTFSEHSLIVIVVYCVLFVIAAVGNLTVFVTLSRGRHRKSRISLMICHLSLADLFVTFVMIPIEVGWQYTVQWVAGNLACKIIVVLRAFGFYLSNNILVCVSLDRYYAVLHPLKVNDARRRGKMMLAVAWICSFIYAVPQSVVYAVSNPPEYPHFKQCVTFSFLVTRAEERAYNIVCMLALYFIPLGIICCVYSKILCEISNKSRESRQAIDRSSTKNLGRCKSSISNNSTGSRLRLRRSDVTNIERARSRTLRMTITIVAVFIACWTPCIVMTLWQKSCTDKHFYFTIDYEQYRSNSNDAKAELAEWRYTFDRDSAERVDKRLQDAFFIMAVGNCCANPLVYGSYAVDFRKECCRCFIPYRTSKREYTDYKLTRISTGQKNAIKRPPGASKLLVHRVQRAVHNLFKVGSVQNPSTAPCNSTAAPVTAAMTAPEIPLRIMDSNNAEVPENSPVCSPVKSNTPIPDFLVNPLHHCPMTREHRPVVNIII